MHFPRFRDDHPYVLIVCGDGFPCGARSWCQIACGFANHMEKARTLLYNWTLDLALVSEHETDLVRVLFGETLKKRQQIIDRGYMLLRGFWVRTVVIIGGDSPWLRHILGLSTFYEIGSIYSRLPSPARPLGGLPGPTTHWLWVWWGEGVGTRHQPHSARSCGLAVRAVGAAGGCPGGRLLPGCGTSGVGRSPTPACPPSGRAAGAHYPLAVGAGGCGPGDPSPTPQRALLRAGFARCGGGMRVPGGGASCLAVGRPG